MFDIPGLLDSIDPAYVYLLVGLIIGAESMGIPLPGETTLVAATLIAARGDSTLNPWLIATSASIGAIVGDSIGYALGRTFGRRLIVFLRRFFPKHFGEDYVNYAEHLFSRYGFPTVFFGRFIALLRILAGPLAGVLHMRYPRFLLANATGGLVWAWGTTALLYQLGVVAEEWLSFGAWVALGVVLIAGGFGSVAISRRLDYLVAEHAQIRASADELPDRRHEGSAWPCDTSEPGHSAT